MIFVHQAAELRRFTTDAAELIEEAGRVCYRSAGQPGRSADFVRMLIGRRHESVLEHASATFLLTTDRAIANELERHRLMSFSQESTRYVNYSKTGEIQVVSPFGDGPADPDWLRAIEEAETRYLAMVRRGIPLDVARSVLPLCTATRVVATTNLREWRHVMRLRRAKDAHFQMRELAGMIFEALRRGLPAAFEDLLPSAILRGPGGSP